MESEHSNKCLIKMHIIAQKNEIKCNKYMLNVKKKLFFILILQLFILNSYTNIFYN